MNNTRSINFSFQQSFTYVVLIILFLTPVLRFSWDISPKTLINILSLALLLVLVNTYKPIFDKLLLTACLIFSIAICVSSILNSNKSFFISDALIVVDCVFLAYASMAITRDDKKTLLIIPVLIGSVLSLIVLIRLLLTFIKFDSDYTGIADIFINFNVIAGYLLMALPLSLILWEYSKGMGITVSLLILCGLFATGSRSASVIGVVLAVIIYFSRRNKGSKLWPTIFSAITLFAATGLIILLKPRIADSISNRLSWINTAISMFIKNPFLGIGWGNYGSCYTAYKSVPGLNSLYAHNIVFQILAESGMIGFVSFVFLIFSFFKQIDLKYLKEGSSMYLPMLLSVSAFLCFNLFDYGFYIPALTVLFFFVLGSTVNMNLTPRNSSLWAKLISVLIFIAASSIFVRPLISSIMYEHSLYYFNNNDYTQAQKYAETSISYDKKRWQAYSKLAEIQFTGYTRTKDAAELQKAIDNQNKAINYCPQNAALHSDMAWLYLRANKRDEAHSEIEQAILLDKFNEKYKNTLALIETNK